MIAEALPALLEREHELTQLAERIERLCDERAGGTLLIEGPPGIGKSALLAQALADTAVPVLRARGSELEAGLAFGAVRQLFGPAVQRLARPDRAALLDGPARLAARVLGFGAGGDGALADPLFSLHWLLGELAGGEPLIVAIDDLHWIDEESARFVDYLVRRLADEPILLLATLRPNEPGTTVTAPTAPRLRPPALSADAVGQLLADRDATAAHRVTGGNPLLVTQLAQAPSDIALDDVAVHSVADMVLARVARAGPAAEALARAVSLFPGGATLEVAATVADLALVPAANAADSLVAADVLTGTETLEFVHPMMRTAVYDRFSTFARRAGHATAARLLRERGAPTEVVAAHLLNGAAEGHAENVRILRRAADAALNAAAPRGAVRYLERALEEPAPEGRPRFEVLFDVGRLRGRLAREDAVTALERAADAAPGQREHADASTHLAAVLIHANRIVEARSVLERLRDHTELDVEQLLMTDTLLLACATELRDAAGCLAIAARIPDDLPGDTPAQRAALSVRWYTDWSSDGDDDNLDGLLRCIADDGSSLFDEYGTYFDPVTSFLLIGAFDQLEALADARAAAARERGDEGQYLTAVLARAWSLQLRGRWLAAEAEARLVLDHPDASADHRRTAWETIIEALIRQLRIDEATAAIERLAELDPHDGRTPLRRAMLGDVTGDLSHYEEYKREADWNASRGYVHPAQSRWLCSYAESLARDGRGDEARAVIEDYVRVAEPSSSSAAAGHGLLSFGRIETGERAIDLLQRAVAVLLPSPHEWLRGWAQLELGAALRRENRRADARPHLYAALAYATEHGEALIARRATEELKLAGGRTSAAIARGHDELTPAEQRVARLAADGQSNKQIAAELFLTVGSVQTTMIRVYRKLGINSRKALPEVLNGTRPAA